MTLNRGTTEAAANAGRALNDLAAALEAAARLCTSGNGAAAGAGAGGSAFSFRPAKTMREAAAMAAETCRAWRIEGDTDNTRLEYPELRYASEEQDMRVSFGEEDAGKYYLVQPDGSIGVTLDGCGSIEWIFLPF